jgi:hypothetical protein
MWGERIDFMLSRNNVLTLLVARTWSIVSRMYRGHPPLGCLHALSISTASQGVWIPGEGLPPLFPCMYTPLTVAESRARILKHFKVTAEKIALGKVNFSNGILKQPDLSLTAVCHCGQETFSYCQWWALKRRKHRFILKATILYEKSNGLVTFSKVGSVTFIVPMIFSKLSPLILS